MNIINIYFYHCQIKNKTNRSAYNSFLTNLITNICTSEVPKSSLSRVMRDAQYIGSESRLKQSSASFDIVHPSCT